MRTSKFADVLLASGIRADATEPGFTTTDSDFHARPRSVDAVATVVDDLATLCHIGPTGGGSFQDGRAAR